MKAHSRHLLTAVAAVSAFATGFAAAVIVTTPSGDRDAAGTPVAAGSTEPTVDDGIPAWDDDDVHLVVTTETDSVPGVQQGPARAPHGSRASDATPTPVADATPTPVADATTAAVASRLWELDGVVSVVITAPGLLAVAISTPDDRATVEATSGVTGVVDDVPLGFTDEPNQYQQWALANSGSADQAAGWPGVADADIDAMDAWTVTRGGGVLVAVIDSGFDTAHPDLAANIWQNTGEICGNGIDDEHDGYVDDCTGWDFGSGDNDVTPETGATQSIQRHGTHVAGIIGAARNGIGGSGVAPEATVMTLKVSRGSSISMAPVLAAVQYALAHGAVAINLSIATGPNTARSSVPLLEQAMGEARAAAVFVAAGAGNNSFDVSAGPAYPAGFSQFYDNVVSVGATTNSDGRASFSNFGSTVDLYAPGFFISSTVPGGYDWMSGTSMATPMVVGTAALVRAAGRAIGPAAIRALLLATADPTIAGPRISAAAAVGAAEVDVDATVTFTGFDTLRADEVGSFTVSVTSATTASAPELRLSAASIEAGAVVAVEGIEATVTPGPGQTTSDERGLLATLQIPASELASGTTLDVTASIPAGSYAFVIELADPTWGAPALYAATTTVDADGAPPEAPTTVVGSPVTTPAPSTSPVTTAPASPSTAPSSVPDGTVPGSTVPGATETVPPPPGPTTTAPNPPAATAPATSSPGTTASTSPATTSAAPAPTTPRPPATTPTTGAAPWTPTTAPASSPSTSAAPTVSTPQPSVPTTSTLPRVPSTGAPTPVTTAAPATTAPPPVPDRDGAYRLDSVSPRQGASTGGGTALLTGVFPMSIDLYVWFGDLVVSGTSSDGRTVSVRAPAHPAPGAVDLSVRFTTDRAYTMTLARGYTFLAPGTTTPATTAPATTAPATTAPGTTTPASRPATPTSSTPPTGTSPPSPVPTAPAATTPASTAPAPTSAPPATTPVTRPPTAPAVRGHRGTTTLRQPTTAALSLVPVTVFSAPCHQQTCPAGRLG